MITNNFEGYSKVMYLQRLNLKYGSYKVAVRYSKDQWSKWYSITEKWNDWNFLNKVTDRSVLESEIILDVDPLKNETADQIRERFHKICDKLEKLGIRQYKGFFSGSKGYHIHFFDYDLIFYTEYERREIRERIIRKFKCDEMKKSEKSMISLEYNPNMKTGNLKELKRGGYNAECFSCNKNI